MAKYIQSDGRIAVLQQFLFENEDLLNKIPGVHIDRTKIGDSAGHIDDLLGKGTSSALESLLIAAQIDAGVTADKITDEFNDTTRKQLRKFLVARGVDAEDVKQFIKDTVCISKNGELAHLYKGLANADQAAIRKAFDEKQDNNEQKTPEPESDEEKKGEKTPETKRPVTSRTMVVKKDDRGTDQTSERLSNHTTKVISQSLPSFRGLGEPFFTANVYTGSVPLDITKPGDISVTMADIKKIEAKDNPSPDERKLVAIVEHKHAERLASNPDYQKLKKQIAEYERDIYSNHDDMQECMKDLKKTAMALDKVRDEYGNQSFYFNAKVDGEVRTFHLSMNQLKNGNIQYTDSNGNVEKVGMLEFIDKAAVRKAGLEAFNKLMMKHVPEYAQQVAEYNEKAKRFVDKNYKCRSVTENFEEHYHTLSPAIRALQDGDFFRKSRLYNNMGIADLEDKVQHIENNISDSTYVVTRSELDAFNLDRKMVAEQTDHTVNNSPSI